MNNSTSSLIYSKKQLERKYYYLSRNDFRKTINNIIADFRKINYDEAKWIKNLRPNEVTEFISVVGEPKQPQSTKNN